MLVSVPATPAVAATTTGVLLGTAGVVLWCGCCVGVGGGGCGPAAPLFVSSSPFRHFGGLAEVGGRCRRRRPLSPNTEPSSLLYTMYKVLKQIEDQTLVRNDGFCHVPFNVENCDMGPGLHNDGNPQ